MGAKRKYNVGRKTVSLEIKKPKGNGPQARFVAWPNQVPGEWKAIGKLTGVRDKWVDSPRPPRYVGERVLTCQRCGRDFKGWMTDYRIWKKLPPKWRKKVLCTRCFRDLTPVKGTSTVPR